MDRPLYPCDAIFVSGECNAADVRRLRDALLPPPRGLEEVRREFSPEETLQGSVLMHPQFWEWP